MWLLIPTIILLNTAASPPAAEWTQWRGPGRDAVSGTPAPARWPAELTRRWRVPAGAGQSSPVVSGRTVFLFTREGDEEVARALDLDTGAPRWRRSYRAPYTVYPGAASFGSGPRSTPVAYQGRLFTLGISGILSAFDARDGRLLWQKDFAGRFPATAPPFGTAMSPLVAAGLLVVHAGGHDGGALIAFDPATGSEKWVREGEGPSYSSPILATIAGTEQIVIQVHRKLLGVEPATGRALWSVPFVTPCDQNIVTPVVAGGLLVVSSVDQGTQGIQVARAASGWQARTAWHTQDVSLYMSSPVVVDGRVLGLSHRRRGQYFGLDAGSGRVVWTGPAGAGQNAAFVVAGDAVLILQGDGRLLVLPRGAEGFVTRASYQVAEGATYAHPVPTTAGILIKDEGALALYAAGTTAAAR
jgi:outer membrane protein assembly factor BamB